MSLRSKRTPCFSHSTYQKRRQHFLWPLKRENFFHCEKANMYKKNGKKELAKPECLCCELAHTAKPNWMRLRGHSKNGNFCLITNSFWAPVLPNYGRRLNCLNRRLLKHFLTNRNAQLSEISSLFPAITMNNNTLGKKKYRVFFLIFL